MANGERWTIETVPREFWTRIEAAGGDKQKYKEALAGLSEEQLKETMAQFDGLAQSLIRSGFDRFPAELRHELTERLEEFANWVITQGRAYYEDVLANPEKFPVRSQVRRPIFAGAIIEEYTRRFGPWRD